MTHWGFLIYTDYIMIKKDYIEIAKILNKYRYDEHMIILKLCELFKKDNKNFNSDKFIDACVKCNS